jgi:hypothetical protein
VQNGSELTAQSIVQGNLMIGGSQMPSAVPEPKCFILLAVFGVCAFGVKHRRLFAA